MNNGIVRGGNYDGMTGHVVSHDDVAATIRFGGGAKITVAKTDLVEASDDASLTAVYAVEDMAALEAAFAKFAKRAARVGVEAPTFSVLGTEEREIIVRREGSDRAVRTGTFRHLTHVVVSARSFAAAGWSFVAALDHELGEDNTVVRTAPGQTMPESFRSTGAVCEHCGANRRRNSTYVLRHESGAHKQVGSTCLESFLGTDVSGLVGGLTIWCDVDVLLNRLSDEEGFSEGSFRAGKQSIDLATYLGFVVGAINAYGWTSRGASMHVDRPSTADLALNQYVAVVYGVGERDAAVVVTDADKALALQVVEWMSSLAEQEGLNDYLYNLGIYGRAGRTTFKGIGLVASAVTAYRRDLAKRQETIDLAATSTHVGTVGARLTASVRMLGMSQGQGAYGPWTLYSFVTVAHAESEVPAGAVLKVFHTGKDLRLLAADGSDGDKLEAGDEAWITFAVKKHDNYKGVAQTMMNRVAVVFGPSEAKARAAAAKTKEIKHPTTPEVVIDGVTYPVFARIRADGVVEAGYIVREPKAKGKAKGKVIYRCYFGNPQSDAHSLEYFVRRLVAAQAS